MKFIFFLFFAGFNLVSFPGTSQDKKIQITDNHGKIILYTTNNYNIKGKEAILNLDKYIDTLKQIWVFAGNVQIGTVSLKQLKSGQTFYPIGGGKNPSGIIVRGGDKIISLKLIQGKLKITCDVDGFDMKYIARIHNNTLIPSKADYHLYASDKYFELFDDYYIPVLQVELISNENAIYIGGAFNDSLGYNIISKEKGFKSKHFMTPIMLMSQARQDSIKYYYIQEAKSSIKCIHEE